MDHRLVEEQNMAESYVMGQLPPAEEARFEEHLLECRECRERVAWADDLRDSVRAAAAEDAARATLQLGFLAWLARRSRAARLGLLSLVLLALAALPAWLLIDRARLERELAAARNTAERPAPPVPSPVPPPADDEELARLAQERSRLEEELRQERAARETLADRIAQITRPQVNTAVYSLGVIRGESEPDEIELGPSAEWIVLSLELPQAEHAAYRATLLDAGGKAVWRSEGLHPTASDTLTILLYSDLLQPGAYRFRLEGMEERGSRAVPAGEIPFRVRRE
jgi:Putative zinc-finger